MPDPSPSEGSLLGWALGGLAAFTASIVLWDRRRSAKREDREFAARKNYSDKLAELPARLDALIVRFERIEKLEGGYHALREQILGIKAELNAIKETVRRK
jgi:uncharacterized membrane protein